MGQPSKLLVGVTGVVLSGQQVLLGRRIQERHWEFPGGRHESCELLADTCVREVKEETGLMVDVNGSCGYYQHRGRTDKNEHWLNMIYHCRSDLPATLQQNLEPDKFDRWRWYPIDDMPFSEMWDAAIHVYFFWMRWYEQYRNRTLQEESI